ncbi:hypothetical protein CDD82_3647 [Ophiocordyceps australis]|uniref:SAM-dependent MTase RsmB/NOP-type domain-containing protein n=1 Tax=Ophiocordyceps australis TaxID=1399860 RepID=A0A2C5ZAV5_9HYPO|nr:hypothetical protein CDD82_3647 [Ophiocordyceps australis]
MGKRGFRGKARRGGGGRRGTGAVWRDYAAVPKVHAKLQEYYDELLQFCPDEKTLYWEALRRELPNSFRFCGSKGHALAVKRLLQSRYIPEIVKIEHHDGSAAEAPRPVPWYPDELAWWMTTPKNVIRKFPPFAAFQKFLVSETSVGNISRQEVVSMIPPLLMDLRPGMTVLDMCAAPGSKSAQLLEMVHRGEEARVRKVLRSIAQEHGVTLGKETRDELEADLDADCSDHGRATGLLIANDSDFKRGHMLVHQLKRLSSPNLLVTNHDATQFPSLKLPSSDAAGKKNVYLKFDRILADVPCSGDGTIRKNANLWKEWQPGNALGLHTTQIRILLRALQLLKVGGRVVFSTCSMNPVENEAVIASTIDQCGGPAGVDIVDCSDQLPALKRKPGLTTWKIMDKSGRMWDSWKQVCDFAQEENNGIIPGRVVETMFPKLDDSDCSHLPLERCMRVYPHLQDTGGFFITVLEKKADFKLRNQNGSKSLSKTPAGDSKTVAADINKDGSEQQPVSTETDGPLGNNAKEEDDSQMLQGMSAVKDDQDCASSHDGQNGSKRPLDDDAAEGTQATKRVKTGEETTQKPQADQDKTEEAQPDTCQAHVTVTEADSVDAPKPHVLVKPAQSEAKPKRNGPPEEPYKFLQPTHPVIENIKQFYSISRRFPDDRYMVRNEMGEPAKAIYYTSALTRDILLENEGRGVKFIHGGVRMFMKQDAPSAEVCRWRIQSEGMPILQGYVGEPRVIHLRNKETLRKLLIEMFPRISDDEWQRFDEIGEQVRDVGMGCCVLRVEPDGDDADFVENMALPLWKSIHSLNLMLPKEDRAAMLLRVYNDTTPLVNTSLQKKQQQQQQQQQQTDKDAAENGEAENGAGSEEETENVQGESEEAVEAKHIPEVDVEALQDLPSPASASS